MPKQTSTTMNSAMPKRISKQKPWSAVHVNAHRNLFNKWKKAYPDTKDTSDNYIYNNRRQLHSFVKNLDLSLSSDKGFYFMIVRWLEINKPDDRYIKMFQQHGYNVGKEIQQFEKEGTQTQREIESYRGLDDLKNMLHLVTEEKKETTEYLLLACVVLQPTLRASFYSDLKIISQASQNDGVSNFVFINRRTRKSFFIVNQDKVSNSYEFSNGKNSKIEIEDKELKTLIINSIDSYPRTYLFENPETERSYTYSTLLQMLHRITGINNISFNMLRSSHVNNLHNKPGTNLLAKEKLAKQMRHSIDASITYYHKPGLLDEAEEQEQCSMIRTQLLQAKTAETKANKKANEVVTDQKANRKRKEMIRKINARGSQPTQKSIDNYNLEFNEDTGMWF